MPMERRQTDDLDGGASEARNRHAARRFWWVLGLLCLAAAGARLAMLDEFVRENPQAECPISDAGVYWEMAGRMAEGQWLDRTPFLSAPLYPYFLGVIRTLGGGLLAVYGIQLLMHIGTGVLIADAARRRWTSAAGLLAAGCFFLLDEPAVGVTRVLADTSQLLLAALLWRQWSLLALNTVRRWRDVLLTGAWIGLFALTYPAALLLLPAYGLWLIAYDRARPAALVRAAAGVGIAAVVVAPATLHNLLGHGEFIVISAHGGITLLQGNNPDATGNLAAVPGVSLSRAQMHADAARVYQRVHGRTGSWREIDAFFRDQALNWWRVRPGDALRLVGRKLYYFLNVRNYSDVMSATTEREAGVAERTRLAPLPTPWIFGFVLIGLCAAMRRPLRHAPELLLTLLPLLVVLLFFYTPRYRLPLLPTACGLTGGVVAYWASFVVGWRARRRRLVRGLAVLGLGAVFVMPLPMELYHRRLGFDAPERIRGHFLEELSRAEAIVGDRRLSEKDDVAAEKRYSRALAWWAGNAAAQSGLATLELRAGRSAEAVARLQEAVRLRPAFLPDRRRLYNAYCALQDYRSAAETLRDLVLHAPQDAAARLALTRLLATCPDDSVRDAAAAVAQLPMLERLAGIDPLERLEVSAAVRAAEGDFDQAVALAERARETAARQNRVPYADLMRQRVEEYRRHEAQHAPPRMLRVE